MRILVTGGTGFLGSHLVESLLSQGHHVIALDNFWTSDTSNLTHLSSSKSLEIIEHDVTAPFPSTLHDIDQIYHLACPASPRHFCTHPLGILSTCYSGTLNALEFARQHSARFLITSTSEIYGQALECPQKETYRGNTNCFGPRACYDEGKRVAEALVYAYRQQYESQVRVARVFNTYGPGMGAGDGRVVSNFVSAALEGRELRINGDGTATRCFQFVADCVEGLEKLMNSEWEGGPVNLGNEKEMTVGELAGMVLEVVEKRTDRSGGKVVLGEELEDDPIRRRPDCGLAREVLGWEPKIELEEGLRRTVEWFLEKEVQGKDQL